MFKIPIGCEITDFTVFSIELSELNVGVIIEISIMFSDKY